MCRLRRSRPRRGAVRGGRSMPPHVAVGGAVKDQHRLLAQLYERRFGRGQSIAKANCVQRVSRWAPARSGPLDRCRATRGPPATSLLILDLLLSLLSVISV